MQVLSEAIPQRLQELVGGHGCLWVVFTITGCGDDGLVVLRVVIVRLIVQVIVQKMIGLGIQTVYGLDGDFERGQRSSD